MSTNNDGTALEALKLTLNEIQSYLILLAKARQRLRPWIFANQQKDRFAQLNAALDKALAMFSATKILSTAEDVRATACHVGVLVSTVERLNSDAKSTLMVRVFPLGFEPGAASGLPPDNRDETGRNGTGPQTLRALCAGRF